MMNLKKGMICAGDPNGGKSPCNGDSGGPLSYQHSDGKIYQVGVVSWYVCLKIIVYMNE